MRSTKTSTTDAVTLLIEDHQQVKSAFKKFEELGSRAFAAKKKLADEICLALTLHTTIEEKVFYPAVREAVKGGDELIDEAIVEHAGAKDLIAQIQSMSAEEDLFDAKIKVLSEQIDHHVKEEESEMFPKARKSNLDLNALGEEMSEHKSQLIDSMPMQPRLNTELSSGLYSR